MFTKEQVENYFDQIRELEEQMGKLYTFIWNNVEDEKLSNFFEKLAREEQEHETFVDEMKSILENMKG